MNENVYKENIKRASRVLTSISALVVATALALLVWWQSAELKETNVVFLDVGQGDAILIQQGNYQVLIDGGKDGKKLLSELGRYVPFWDRKIEIVIFTHPDADHIGGFAMLPKVYDIGSVFFNGAEGETDYFTRFVREVGTDVPFEKWQLLRAGSELVFPEGGKLSIIYPNHTFEGAIPDGEVNEGSIVSIFEYGGTSFLLTGDLSYEETVLKDLTPITVLKVAHHGSKYSTSSTFLNMVQPKGAVISVGENNYGHPTKEVLGRLETAGVKVLRTDEEGSIRYVCQKDGCIYAGPRKF
jgi:competence protein ComEC